MTRNALCTNADRARIVQHSSRMIYDHNNCCYVAAVDNVAVHAVAAVHNGYIYLVHSVVHVDGFDSYDIVVDDAVGFDCGPGQAYYCIENFVLDCMRLCVDFEHSC